MNNLRIWIVLTSMIPWCLPVDQPILADELVKPDNTFIESASFKGKAKVYKISPDGKLSFKSMGRKAQIIEVKSGQPFGPLLDAGVMWSEHHLRSFSCWTFSPDGKYLVTGSAFFERSGSRDRVKTVVGRIQIWAVATGKQLATSGGRIGSVQSLAFSEDGKNIVYSAAPYEIDGP